jgi:haloalkane dehalogenase
VQQAVLPWYERWNLDVQEFSAAGIRTFAVVEGKPDAFPVIFLHGLPSGAFIWADAIKGLERARLSIAPDLPGWGRSVTRFAKIQPDLSMQGLREWLNGLLVAQSVDRFDLVTHGDSAWPAMELLMTDPLRVRRLALFSAQLWVSGERVGVIPRLLGKAKWSRKRIARWLDERAMLTPRARQDFQAQFDSALGDERDARTSPMLSEMGHPARIGQYLAALTAYKGATLLIWGQNDPAAPEERIAGIKEKLSGADVHRIAEAGYFPMLDAPDEVSALLKDFLRE